MHDLTARPSSQTVHAPQFEVSQPTVFRSTQVLTQEVDEQRTGLTLVDYTPFPRLMVTARISSSPSAGSRVCEWAMVYTLGPDRPPQGGGRELLQPVKESYGLLETHLSTLVGVGYSGEYWALARPTARGHEAAPPTNFGGRSHAQFSHSPAKRITPQTPRRSRRTSADAALRRVTRPSTPRGDRPAAPDGRRFEFAKNLLPPTLTDGMPWKDIEPSRPLLRHRRIPSTFSVQCA